MSKQTQKSKATLSLAMMVKNEERFLEDALLSAKNWVDEMVVVDTGSTDRTVEIANDCGAKVSYFEWPNDFSKARNETIRRSNGDWIAILDADERFRGDHPQRIRELLKPSSTWPYQAIMLNVVNQRLDGSTTHTFFSPRIFPRHPDLGYYGRIHNCFGSLSMQKEKEFEFIQCNGLEIIHLGYDQEVYREKNKESRNLTLLEAAVREEPEVDRYRYYLGLEYSMLKRYDEAKRMLETVFELSQVEPMCHRQTQLAYLQCLFDMQAPFEQLLTQAVTILDSTPQEADAWYLLSLIYLGQGYQEESIEALIQALNYVDELDVNMQTSRLKGERAKAEVVLAQHYAQSTQHQDKAKEWYYKAWSHLSPQDEDWTSLITHILQWSIHTEEVDMLKMILKSMAENPHNLRIQQAFLIALKTLADLDSKRPALKFLKLAIKTQANLRVDPSFVQLLRELKS